MALISLPYYNQQYLHNHHRPSAYRTQRLIDTKIDMFLAILKHIGDNV
jgi:hypothetical protein